MAEPQPDALPVKSRWTRRKDPRRAEQAKQVQNLAGLLAFLQIRETDWDYLLIGDGSATTWEKEAGFASVLVSRNGDPPKSYWGSFSNGTNIVAELMAYVLPLLHLLSGHKAGVRRLHIVTDCEFLVQAAGNVERQKAHRELWLVVESAKRKGLICRWHWAPRDCLDLNKFSHKLANDARKTTAGLSEAAAAGFAFTTIPPLVVDGAEPS